eukprot:scaffold1328_cov375-Pavlova_lutheri.AAC.5
MDGEEAASPVSTTRRRREAMETDVGSDGRRWERNRTRRRRKTRIQWRAWEGGGWWRILLVCPWTRMASASQGGPNQGNKQTLHVALAPGPSHCEPAAVTVASIGLSLPWTYWAHVHVFQGRDKCNPLMTKLDEKLTNVQISFHPIVHNISMEGPVCERRKELCTKENFASFLAPQILDVERILYLDVDTLVVGDVSQLLDFELGQAPAAGVEDCSQTMVRYFPDQQETLERYPSLPESFFDACVINRGVVLINVVAWKEFRMTEKILQIFAENLEKPLWQSGVSQPPFLLALAYHPFKRLPHEYNVRGLGRTDISSKEFTRTIHEEKTQCEVDKDLFMEQVWGHAKKLSVLSPFAHPFTHCGKILHYTGTKKPWKGRSDAICSCGFQCLQPCRDFYLFFERYVAVLLGEEEDRWRGKLRQ